MERHRYLIHNFAGCTRALFGSTRRTLATLLVTAFVLQLAGACVPVLTWRVGTGYSPTVEFELHGTEFHGGYWRGYWRTDFWWLPAHNHRVEYLQGWAKTYPDEFVPPRWSQVHSPELVSKHLLDGWLTSPTGIDQLLATRNEIAVGMPFRSFTCMLVNETDDTGAILEEQRCEGGLRFAPFRVLLIDERVVLVTRVVPLRPLLSGIVLNTLVFWAVLLMLARLWMPIRTLRRFERGCCPRCGVGLGFAFGRGCPSCYWRARATESAHG